MGKNMKTDILELKESGKALSGYDWPRIK